MTVNNIPNLISIVNAFFIFFQHFFIFIFILIKSSFFAFSFTLFIKVKNLEILHKSDDLYYGKLKKDQEGYKIEYPERKLPREDLLEPFLVAGDLMGFTIKRGTLNSKQVDYIFEQKKKELGINYSFHKANGFYETDKWEEGAEKYFRGYCIQQLEENSKIEEKKQEELER